MGIGRRHAVKETWSFEGPDRRPPARQEEQLPDPSLMVVPHYGGQSGGLRRTSVAEADPLAGAAVAPGVVDALRRRQGRGRPLPDDLASSWGGHFGQDLSALRVHTDPEAGTIARSLQATAFTHGSDIYFAPGAYSPGSDSGRRVVAHEVGHAVAQRTGTDRAAGSALTVGAANDPAERAADRAADGAMSALRRSPATPAGPGHAEGPTGAAAIRRSPSGAIRRTIVESGVLRRVDDPPVLQEEGHGGVALDDRVERPVRGGGGQVGQQRRRGRDREGRKPIDGLALFKEYLASPAHRTLLDNIPSSKLGRFDAEYDPDAGILAITVRPRFDFTGTWSEGEKSTFIEHFKQQASAKWSGKHDFACTKSGMESLRARVVVQVEPAGPGERAHFECTVQEKKSGDTFIGREQYSDPTQLGKGVFSQPDAPERPHDNRNTRCSLAKHDAARIQSFIASNLTLDARGWGVIEFDKNQMKPADAIALATLVKVLKQTTELGATPLPIVVTRHQKGMFDNGKKRAEDVRSVLAANGHYPIRVETAKEQLAALKATQKKTHSDYKKDNATGSKPGGYFDKKAQAEIDQHSDVLSSTNVTIHPDEKWAATYQESDPYSILAHEFGHMLGNPDEYFGYGPQMFELKKEQLLATGKEGDAQVAGAMKINPLTTGDRADIQGGWGELVVRSGHKLPTMTVGGAEATNSMMNAGAIVMPAHYATIWEALGRITSRALPGIKENDWSYGG